MELTLDSISPVERIKLVGALSKASAALGAATGAAAGSMAKD